MMKQFTFAGTVLVVVVAMVIAGSILGIVIATMAETPDDRCEQAFPNAVYTDAIITTNGDWLICRVIEAGNEPLSERVTWVTRNGPVEEGLE